MSKGDTTITYKYDDSGIRTEKKVNNQTIRYTTIDGKITSQSDGTNHLYFYYDEHDSLLGFEYNGTPYLYIKNIQGDVYGITDTSGTLLVQYKYDAWGQVESITGNQALGQMNPMRYRGYYYDEETVLYYLQSRYYDASVRRFINADVFEMIGTNDSYISYNLYAYCENNSVSLIDLNGKSGVAACEWLIWSGMSAGGLLSAGLIVLGGVAVLYIAGKAIEKGSSYVQAHRTTKNGSKRKTHDKHTKPRPGRQSEKKKQKPGWKSRK